MGISLGGSTDKHNCDYCKRHRRDLSDLTIGSVKITLCEDCLIELSCILKLHFMSTEELKNL